MTTIDQPTPAPTRKVTAASIAGTVTALILWAITAWTKAEVPEPVAAGDHGHRVRRRRVSRPGPDDLPGAVMLCRLMGRIRWGGSLTGLPDEPMEIRPGVWVARPYRWVVEHTNGGPSHG